MEHAQKRKIGVVTVGRSDYGIYESLLKKIRDDHSLQLSLFVAGAHLEKDFGFLHFLLTFVFVISISYFAICTNDSPE